MSQGKSGGGIIFLAVIFIIASILLLSNVEAVVKVFAYAGYNTFFFLDNLFDFQMFGPITTWGIWGFLVGSIIGVMVAVKKLRLAKTLILYPIGIVALLLVIMGFVNKPANYTGEYTPSQPVELKSQKSYYTSNRDANFRSGPSTSYPSLFVLKQGSEVELIKSGFVDSGNIDWSKIKYNNQEGYVCTKYIDFARSGY